MVDQLAVDIFEDTAAPVELRQIRHVIGAIILGGQPYGFGLHAQVDVLGDQHHLVETFLDGDVIGRVEDVMVGFGAREIGLDLVVELGFQKNRNASLPGADRNPAVEDVIPGEVVQGAQKFARVAVENILAFLEAVELFDDGDRNNDIMFVELVDTTAVVQDDIGIQNKGLPNFRHVMLLSFATIYSGVGLWHHHIMKAVQIKRRLPQF